jgi:hypothetical protein
MRNKHQSSRHVARLFPGLKPRIIYAPDAAINGRSSTARAEQAAGKISFDRILLFQGLLMAAFIKSDFGINPRSLRPTRALICPFPPKAGGNGALKTRARYTAAGMTILNYEDIIFASIK